MITLKTEADCFKILNLTDPQLCDDEWCSTENTRNRDILTMTVNELIGRVKPDLITISGDISVAGNDNAYKAYAVIRRMTDFLK